MLSKINRFKKNRKSKKNSRIKKAGANAESSKIKSLKNLSFNYIKSQHKINNSKSLFRDYLSTKFRIPINHPYIYILINIRTDEDINNAVSLWCNNPEDAEVQYGHISDWDTSRVTNMKYLFYEKNDFNDDIRRWDVSSVTNMSFMFRNAGNFNNGDLLGQSNNPLTWDVSNVTNMNGMFTFAKSFNQNIGQWDVSKVTDMALMFWKATSFNQDINTKIITRIDDSSYKAWDVSKVTNMYSMFNNCPINIPDWYP